MTCPTSSPGRNRLENSQLRNRPCGGCRGSGCELARSVRVFAQRREQPGCDTIGQPMSHHFALWVFLLLSVGRASAQSVLVVEDFEFASSDEAAAAGIIDLTDLANSPAFYISGADENASHGLYSIGTDAVF